jgi:hypothetical protein
LQAEFAIETGNVTLVKFSSGNKPPVKGIIDVPMKLKDLIKVCCGSGFSSQGTNPDPGFLN